MVTNYDYYKKYIKYKNKYLQYKYNLRGATHNLEPQSQPLAVVILASHQNAIGELLNMMVEGYSLRRKKIKNCACIEISKVVVGNGKARVQVRMVYEGELDPRDTSKNPQLYFTVDKFNECKYKFKDEHIGKIGLNVKLLLIRHGNGPHNAKTGFLGAIVKMSDPDIYTDPLLTQLGIEQAQRAYLPIMNTIL
jgi:broad specificity phosphatase PhoE